MSDNETNRTGPLTASPQRMFGAGFLFGLAAGIFIGMLLTS